MTLCSQYCTCDISLHPTGLKVGLLDADIYGPSVPLLMGVKGAPKLNEKSQMIPHVAHGVSCMSMGFLMKGARQQ